MGMYTLYSSEICVTTGYFWITIKAKLIRNLFLPSRSVMHRSHLNEGHSAVITHLKCKPFLIEVRSVQRPGKNRLLMVITMAKIMIEIFTFLK